MNTSAKKTTPVKKPSTAKKKRSRKKSWVRILLAVLRFFLIPCLCLIALYVGLVIGYVDLGKQNYAEIFTLKTWKHVYDLVFSNT